MKNSFIILLSIISVCALGQTQQNINKITETVSNAITSIDSIRFNSSSTNMEVVLQNGTLESHSISDILNVNFISASQHSCGVDSVHNPNLSYGSMTDQQGNVYKTIAIGTQEWMAENLKTSIYRNGESIANITDSIQWSNLITGAWCYYNNDIQFECPYGKLYNWYTVVDSRNVCPTGWHMPTDGEWSVLINYFDPTANGGSNFPNSAGGKLKSPGLQYWLSPNQDAINESGFSGLPAGLRHDFGAFSTIGFTGSWWSSTEFSIAFAFAWGRNLSYFSGDANRSDPLPYKNRGYSLRCLRD